jgi:hypothetical protein
METQIKKLYPLTRGILMNKVMADETFWTKRFKIPFGTDKPYSYYQDATTILKETISLEYDNPNLPATSRNAINWLFLGASGDGKSLQLKNLWYFLKKAGYRIIYIDPKSMDSGNAKEAWTSSTARFAPHVEPEGIELEHFIPYWKATEMPMHEQYFRKYSMKITDIKKVEMWEGLGMTRQAARTTAGLIKKHPDVTIEKLLVLLAMKTEEEGIGSGAIAKGTYDNAERILMTLQDLEFFSDKAEHIERIFEKLDEDKSVCISYNMTGREQFPTFEIGFIVKYAAERALRLQDTRPLIFIFDDTSYYTKKLESGINYAIEQIVNIGHNYRSLGIGQITAAQATDMLQDGIDEVYTTKFISPLFNNMNSLSDVGITQEAIQILKEEGEYALVRDLKRNMLQWVAQFKDKTYKKYFPFTPCCNHFEPVYTAIIPEHYEEES